MVAADPTPIRATPTDGPTPSAGPTGSATRLPRRTPEQQGVAPAGLLALVDALESIDDVHSLMVVTDGAVIAEGWWAPYTPERRHQLFSVTKTFTAIAVGFAAAEGLLSVDDLLLDHLGDQGPAGSARAGSGRAAVDPNLARMRLRHLLTMTTGHDQDPSDRIFTGQDWVGGFLALPVEHEPGTHFVYNTAATHLLSAVVQKVSGLHLVDYLTPRLLEPLGIVGATCERDPQGIDAGGFGLSATTEDLAVLGRLLLDEGVLDGRQVLPSGWVREATRVHTPTDGPVPDWAQGYGYQMWHGRHGSFRGDGAFGQFCLVLPEQRTVVAITGGTLDMQGVLDAVWTHLLPAVGSAGETGGATAVGGAATGGGAPDDGVAPFDAVAPDAAARLADRLTTLRHEPPAGRTPEPGEWSAELEPNPLGLGRLRVQTTDGSTTVTVSTSDPVVSEITVRAGHGSWHASEVTIPWSLPARPAHTRHREVVVAGAVQTGNGALQVTVRLLATPFVADVEIVRDGDRVTATGRLNVAFGRTDLPPVHGQVTS